MARKPPSSARSRRARRTLPRCPVTAATATHWCLALRRERLWQRSMDEKTDCAAALAAPCIWLTRNIIFPARSEEHTSELQSLRHLVCRLLLEKKNSHLNVEQEDDDSSQY